MDPSLRKKIYIMAGILGGGILLILLVIFLMSLLFGGAKSYAQIEVIMQEAAVDYYKDNANLLPTEEGVELVVSADTLVTAEKMNPLSDLLDDESCTGEVVVTKNGENHLYVPYLDCGENYKTETLAEKLTKEENIVVSEEGLYFMNNEYVYRGEVKNNYVSLNEVLYRIVKVTNDNKIMLIMQDQDDNAFRYYWDNRYNSARSANVGINDYEISRVAEFLANLYETDESITANQHLITSGKFCIGKRDEITEVNDGSVECSVISNQTEIGLLPLYDYINASIDPSCNSSTDPQCQNYNYLAYSPNDWWTATASSKNTYSVYEIDKSGKLDSNNASVNKMIRPVIYLTPSTMYSSGTGTYNDPYIVR